MGPGLPAGILSAVQRGMTVVTANQRAARTLRRAYDRERQAAGETRWTPPGIFALDTWLGTLWSERLLQGNESRLLLNRVQEHAVWRGIIASDREAPQLRSAETLAELAAGAWGLLCEYKGRGLLREFGVSTDTRAFQRWAMQFERVCRREQYLPSAELADVLTRALEVGELEAPEAGVLLVDFDALPPSRDGLFEAIEQAGYAVERMRTSAPRQSASLLVADDDAGEMQVAARWCADELARDANAKVAVVVPDLADRRAALERVFGSLMDASAFEFSLGRALAETAAGGAALDLLRWAMDALPLETVSALLLSPYFGGAVPSQLLPASEFDAFELGRATLLRPEIEPEQMIGLLGRSERKMALFPTLQRMHAMHRVAAAEQMQTGATQSYAGWADVFRAVLEAAGWTQACDADSLSFQTRRRFESALDELTTLDFDGSQVTAAAALKTLERIARQAVFAPESHETPIQIMGPLEPGGIAFDALWFLGADDGSWPLATRPHPLLPWHVQRELRMPGADPVRDGAAAQRLTERLSSSAARIVFSYAKHTEDGERRPSPLLRTLALDEHPAPGLQARHELRALELFADREPLPPLPEGVTPGGARVLELQAACAFRAFAEFRLWSTEPGSREPGLDARDSGTQVHKIMQAFWSAVRTQEALRGMTREERTGLLERCIETGIRRAAGAARSPWEEAYVNVQRKRLHALLEPWLDFELERPPFEVVQQEEKLKATIGPLQLELRADRIDQTGGGLLVLDYKTGLAKPADWLTDRPDAPQLPLYAVMAQAEGLGGLAFALLRAGDDLALTGYADSRDVLAKPSKMPLPLAEQLEEWKRILTELATAFAEADPIAGPKVYPGTCERCGQRILCRLDTATLEQLAEEDEAEVAFD